jgi:hypothetical protein
MNNNTQTRPQTNDCDLDLMREVAGLEEYQVVTLDELNAREEAGDIHLLQVDLMVIHSSDYSSGLMPVCFPDATIDDEHKPVFGRRRFGEVYNPFTYDEAHRLMEKVLGDDTAKWHTFLGAIREDKKAEWTGRFWVSEVREILSASPAQICEALLAVKAMGEWVRDSTSERCQHYYNGRPIENFDSLCKARGHIQEYMDCFGVKDGPKCKTCLARLASQERREKQGVEE